MVDNAEKRRVGLFYGLVGVACVELLTLPAMTIYWRYDRDQRLTAPIQPTLCYKWDRFETDENEEKCPSALQSKIIKNATVCCGSASSVIDKLASKAVNERYNNDANPEISSLDLTEYNCDASKSKLTAVKLMGISEENKPVLVGNSSKVFWNSHSPSTTTTGLEYLPVDGTITVLSSDYYFVSSQLKFTQVINETSGEVPENTLRHYVHRISGNGSVSTILEHAKLTCEMLSVSAEFTSIVGALFWLNKGDQLYVATSHPHLLQLDDKASYFNMLQI